MTSTSISPTSYHSIDAHRHEHHKLFRQYWIGIGRIDRLTETGQFEVLEIAGVSLVLILDVDGRLRALGNSCRHRGTRLADGKGRCRTIRCPFHGWTYGLDGRLVVAPQMESIAGFNRDDFGLKEYPLRSVAGFLFVCLADHPPDWQSAIGDFETVHADRPLGSLKTTRRISFDVNCNWKLFLEVFNEYYHLDSVHPESINALYKEPEPIDKTTGNYASQFGFTKGRGGLMESQQSDALPSMPGLVGSASLGTRYTWLFPNMTFAASSEALWMYEALPLSPESCRVYQTICFHPDTIALPEFEPKVTSYYERFDTAIKEDVVVLEQQQLGLNDISAEPGPIHPLLEAGVGAFANWYKNELVTESVNAS